MIRGRDPRADIIVDLVSSYRQGRLLEHFYFFSSRRRHTRLQGDWSSDVCSSDLQKHLCHPGASRQWNDAHRESPGSARVHTPGFHRGELQTGPGRVVAGDWGDRADRKRVVWGKSVEIGGRRII